RGGGSIAFYKDLDRTCERLARVSRKDADAYRAFVGAWRGVVRGGAEAFQAPPTGANLGWAIVPGAARGPRSDPGRLLRAIAGSAADLVRETFEHDAVRGAIGWLAAQSGVPIHAPWTGVLAGWIAAYHETGAARPRGGSGELARAL